MVLNLKLHIFAHMETTKLDIEKLKTVSTYARAHSVSVTAVYKWIKEGKVKMKEIDGVKFILTK